MLVGVLGMGICIMAHAETFRCQKNGQTVFSDLPCAAGAARVDVGTDRVSRTQRMQAEVVDQRNRRQLSELEYNAAQARNYHGGVIVAPDPAATSSRGYRR